jgi:hypothetical protein
MTKRIHDEARIIEVIRDYCGKHNITSRQFAAATGISKHVILEGTLTPQSAAKIFVWLTELVPKDDTFTTLKAATEAQARIVAKSTPATLRAIKNDPDLQE